MKKLMLTLLPLLVLAGCQTPSQSPNPNPPVVEQPAPSPAKVEISEIPKYGQTNENVKKVQAALNARGAKLTVDGDYGDKTKAAISAYQKQFGLAGSGDLGPKTIDLLGLIVKTSQPEEPEVGLPAEPSEIKLAWNGKHKDADKWTTFTLQTIRTIGADMAASNPLDAEAFCPSYKKLTADERVEFYAQLISKMVQYESSYNPASFMYECSKTKNNYGSNARWDEERGWCMKGGHSLDGGYVISRGLMQMSLESAQSYGCPVKVPQDMHDPYKSLDCAIRVMNRFIPAPRPYMGATRGHGSIAGYSSTRKAWNGAAAYWAVIRETKDANGKVKPSFTGIKTYVSGLALCRK